MVDPSPYLAASQLLQIALTVALAFLLGITREEKAAVDGRRLVGGVRTFPLVALLGYALAALFPDSPVALSAGLVSIAGFLVASYAHKLREDKHGATTEVSVLVAYMVGALVAREMLQVATAVAIISVLLLQMKAELESFAVRLPRQEVTTFVKFLLLAAVVLPVLPNHAYTQFGINPFHVWLVVVAVSGISYAGYLLQRLVERKQSVLVTALLGGAYSSTVTTVVLAKQAREQGSARLYAGAVVLASGTMYVRLAILLWLFNSALGWALGPRMLALWVATSLVGYLVATLGVRQETTAATTSNGPKNPLEISTALMFAALFVGIAAATQYAARTLGAAGVYSLAAIIGMVDIDPFILGLTQSAGATAATPVHMASVAICIAAASNNLMKGIYAVIFGDRRTGLLALALMAALAVATLSVIWGL
jgi:uncharacterized membrane protein (DUF4010 family)